MAGRPIEIIVDANVKGVEDGAKDIADSLEKVEDALEDVQDKAKDTGEELEDALGDGVKGGARDAVNGLEKVEKALDAAGDKGRDLDRDLTKALDEVADKAKSSGKAIDKGIGDGTRNATDSAKAGLGEFKDEANSTAKESAASFDGSAESIADSFQEIAANAFAGFGPAGAAAGLAIAAGIGIAITKLNDLADANTEAAEGAADLGRELYDAGGQLDAAGIADKIKDIGFALASEDNPWTPWANEAKTGIQEVREALDGVDDVNAKKLFEGLAGDVDAGQKVFDELTESIDRDREALSKMTVVQGDHSVSLTTEGRALEDSIEGRERLKEKIEEASGAYEGAAKDVEYYTDVMGQSAEATDASSSSAERAAEVQGEVEEALQRVADAVERADQAKRDLANANMSVVETEIKTIEALNGMTESLVTNGATLDLNTEAGRNNAGAVLETVKALNDQAQAEVDAGASVDEATAKQRNQRDALVNELLPAFNGNRDAAQQYIDKMLAVPKTVKTDVNLDGIPDAQQKLDNFTRQKPTITVMSQIAVSRQEAYNQLNGAYGQHSFAVNINPRGGMQALP